MTAAIFIASAFVTALFVLSAWGSGIKAREESKDE
jgi:hypothetical protein